jgi:hypothetical protein
MMLAFPRPARKFGLILRKLSSGECGTQGMLSLKAKAGTGTLYRNRADPNVRITFVMIYKEQKRQWEEGPKIVLVARKLSFVVILFFVQRGSFRCMV